MADKMTLQQTLSFFRSVIQSGEPWTETCESAYSASMAHIAAMGEPVGFILRSVTPPYDYWPESFVLGEPQEDESETEHWEPIYAHPPTSGDWDKVLEVIAEMDKPLAAASWPTSWLEKLTAALPESQP